MEKVSSHMRSTAKVTYAKACIAVSTWYLQIVRYQVRLSPGMTLAEPGQWVALRQSQLVQGDIC